MTKAAINSASLKSKGQVILEYILLAVCLCVIALRATFTEGPGVESAAQPIGLGDDVYSLSVSAVLIVSFAIWFVSRLCHKDSYYRFSGVEVGIALFAAAAVVGGFAASNKRAAVTTSVTMLAPILMAVLLVQILDSQSRIKLVLACVGALGVVAAYQCVEQLFVSNKMMIEQYRQAPQTILEPLGIQPGTFAQMLFEHRLYSRGIRGFFTTSNSAGSFALLASSAALALFIDRHRERKSAVAGRPRLFTVGLALAIVVFGLAITQSKGAITASVIAAVMFVIYLLFGSRLKAHRYLAFIVCLAAVIAAGCVLVSYGITHDRLPGGNSMLVRWQYWYASAGMYADNPLTGVGPGNFVYYYPHYKVASALETVSDPHNFLLAILTQYGPVGLVGFLAMFFVPLWRAASAGSTISSQKVDGDQPVFGKLAGAFVIVISVCLLLVRPLVMPVAAGDRLDVVIYVIFTLYVAPLFAFAAGFWLLTSNGQIAKPADPGVTVAALFCAVVGCLIHNTIDFAIFEPGVFTALWAVIACLIALDSSRKGRPRLVMKANPFVRLTAAAAVSVLIWAYFGYALLPVARSSTKIQQAQQVTSYGGLEQAHSLLAAAAEDDYYNPSVPSLNSRLYLYHFEISGKRDRQLLAKAEDCLLEAISRNSADYRHFERLAEVYTLLAATSAAEEKSNHLNKAFDNACRAVELYPGGGRLRVELAKIAEQLGKADLAVEQYKKAIEIEDSFREQFRLMYPGQEIISRLGEEKYKNAKQRIKLLSEQRRP
jgi:O-antigen ligase